MQNACPSGVACHPQIQGSEGSDWTRGAGRAINVESLEAPHPFQGRNEAFRAPLSWSRSEGLGDIGVLHVVVLGGVLGIGVWCRKRSGRLEYHSSITSQHLNGHAHALEPFPGHVHRSDVRASRRRLPAQRMAPALMMGAHGILPLADCQCDWSATSVKAQRGGAKILGSRPPACLQGLSCRSPFRWQPVISQWQR